MHLLLLFIAALALSSVFTHVLRNTALKNGWTCSTPRKRDVHHSPIPRLGGVAIASAFVAVVLAYIVCRSLLGHSIELGVYTTFAILAPATLMLILGLCDDLKHLDARQKFGVQIIAALLLYYGGIRINVFPIVSGYHQLNGFLSAALTVLWVLLISNAFNLIDGLDGLSAGSALFSTLVAFAVSLFSGNTLVAVMTATLAGAILGFLRYNFNPATIFLGDCGSLFLGFMLSAVSLAGAQKGTTVIAVAIPIVSFGLPLLDTVLAVIRRFLSGQPLFTADRAHIHHQLLKRGFSHKQAVVMLYGVCAVLGLLSLLMLYPSGSSIGIVMVVVFVLIFIGVQHLGYHEFAEIGRATKRAIDQKQIIVNNLAIRRATEELSTADDLADICSILRAAFEFNEFDGFDLSFQPATDARIPQTFRKEFGGGLHYEWRKPSFSGDDSRWKMELSLRNAGLGQHSRFTLYRGDPARNLLFDVNLLTNDFQSALGDAVERALEGVQPAIILRANETGAPVSTIATAVH